MADNTYDSPPTWTETMEKYGGRDGFYRAIDSGKVGESSEEYHMFYVAQVHAVLILKDILKELRKR